MSRRLRALAVLFVPLFVAPQVTDAQQTAAPVATAAGCSYDACAFGIVPVALGLQVVRGRDERPVATLGFLLTRDISGIFDGEARAAGLRAVRTRRLAAAFTDVGLLVGLAGALRAATNDLDPAAAHLMMAGVAGVGISVPLQFRADRHLARAVWLHNVRFAGSAP